MERLWTEFSVRSPVTLLHELGHALAARCLLPGTVRIESGIGARRWEFTWAGIEFEVSPLTAPLGHAGTCVYEAAPDAREALWIALGGPAATGLGFLVSLAVLPHAHGALRNVVWMLVMTQGFGLGLNLVPFTILDRHGRRIVSDGKAALDALRRPRPPGRRVEPVAGVPSTSTSPPCASCGHRRDEHVDLHFRGRG